MHKEIEEKKVDQESLKTIAQTVVEALTPVIQESVKTEVAAATEKTVTKEVGADVGKVNIVNHDIKSEPKEVRFVKAAMALKSGNTSKLAEYNALALEARSKAGYGSTSVDADGGYLVPDPDFEAAIEKLQPTYGIALNEASVVTINGNAIKTNKRGSNVTMYRTSQAGTKTGTKLTIDQEEVSLEKFAAIAPYTDELSEDSAIDYWNELAQGFAEERARWADRLVFTEDLAGKEGVMRIAGTYAQTIGAAVTNIDWDDLLNAEVKIPDAATANAKWYMHKTLWSLVKQTKDSEGRYQALPTGAKTTPWGSQVVTGDIFPSTSVVGDSNEPYAVYGDLKRVKLYVKRGLIIDMLKEGTVHDADNSAINLGEQDMTAMRAVMRMVALVKFPEAFCVLGTGTVS